MWVSSPRSRSLVALLESLEKRRLLSAAPIKAPVNASMDASVNAPASLFADPASVELGSASSLDPAIATNSRVIGFSPAQIATAYRTKDIYFGDTRATGAGQTIAIVDAYNDTSLVGDLATFDKEFALPPAGLTVMSQTGSLTRLPAVDAGWARETALDVEWAHATAPGARLVLVEADDSSLQNLLLATNEARDLPGVSVVSLSWGTGEFYGENLLDPDLLTPAGHPNETFVAASGDNYAEQWPASSPDVLSVGGTFLSTQNPKGTFAYEKPWIASGGGYSAFEPEPDYQQSVQFSGDRTTPDVSFDADPDSGFAVYDSVAYDGERGWVDLGGTSAGAPQWAGLIAIADQGRALKHAAPLNTQSVLTTIYAAATASPTADNTDFHDVWGNTDGTPSPIYVQERFAGYGYDLFTGFGSPRGPATEGLLLNAATLHPPTDSQFVPVSVVEATPQVLSVDTAPAKPTAAANPADSAAPSAAAPWEPALGRQTVRPSPTEIDLGDVFGRVPAADFTFSRGQAIMTSRVTARAAPFSDTAGPIGGHFLPPADAAAERPPAPTAVARENVFSVARAPLAAALDAPFAGFASVARAADRAIVLGSDHARHVRSRPSGWSAVALLAGATVATLAATLWIEAERGRRARLSTRSL